MIKSIVTCFCLLTAIAVSAQQKFHPVPVNQIGPQYDAAKSRHIVTRYPTNGSVVIPAADTTKKDNEVAPKKAVPKGKK